MLDIEYRLSGALEKRKWTPFLNQLENELAFRLLHNGRTLVTSSKIWGKIVICSNLYNTSPSFLQLVSLEVTHLPWVTVYG